MHRRTIFVLAALSLCLHGLGQTGGPAFHEEPSGLSVASPAIMPGPARMAPSAKPFPVVETTIAGIHKALRQKTCSCELLVTEYLQRIAVYDQSTGLNAIILTNPHALETARSLDNEYARTHRLRPLHCVPIIVKDNYNTAGLQTTAGSLAMKGYLPAKDATMVRKLKDAGAIVLAKSNMAEWAFSPMVTISSIAGETRNPYNLDHVPAGSSGGTAAAVAANLGAAGVGTDTGNSIRGPSSHNSLVGFRPTIGLVSRAGIVPLYLRNDMGGPMARTVEDATRLLEVLAGYDAADPITSHSEGKIPADYTRYLDPNGLKGARIGVLRTLSERDPDPQVKALFEQAIADLRKAGATVIDSVVIDNFDSVSANQWCSVFRQDVNAYLSTPGEHPPVKDLQEVVSSGKYAPYIATDIKYELDSGISVSRAQSADSAHPKHRLHSTNATDLAAATTGSCGDAYSDPRRIAFRKAVTDAMDRYKIGAIIYPTWNNPPAKIGDFAGYKGDNSQIIAPHTGMPAFTVPMGFTYDNLPAGLQFLGRSFDEPTLIRYTYGYEQATHHRHAPEKFPELTTLNH